MTRIPLLIFHLRIGKLWLLVLTYQQDTTGCQARKHSCLTGVVPGLTESSVMQDIWNRLMLCKQKYLLSLKLPHIYSKAMPKSSGQGTVSLSELSCAWNLMFALFCVSREWDSKNQSSLKLHPIEREAKKSKGRVCSTTVLQCFSLRAGWTEEVSKDSSSS